jgi:hypothetical protein
MKRSIALSAALLATGLVTATPEPARAMIYCQYIDYPAGCVVRPVSGCAHGRSRGLP